MYDPANFEYPLDCLSLWDPFQNVVWCMDLDEPITREEVAEVLKNETFEPLPLDDINQRYTRAEHIGRVAWLVRHKQDTLIALDVGMPDFGCYPEWPIIDGNHRLAAAFFRGDPAIRASVSGDLSHAEVLLGLEFKFEACG